MMDAAFGTRMILESPVAEDRLQASLVGLERDNFVVVKVPLTTGVRRALRVGNLVTVRYLYQGRLVGFRVPVLEFITSPATLAFLGYPPDVEVLELRKNQRIDCRFPARVTLDGHTLGGLVLDISPGGMRLAVDAGNARRAEKFTEGQVLGVGFHALDPKVSFTLGGKVQNVSLDGHTLLVGLAYQELSPEVSTTLERYFREIDEALSQQVSQSQQSPQREPAQDGGA